MAKNSTSSTSTTPKKTRVRKPAYFVATLESGDSFIVVAKTQKDALNAVVTIKPATPQDLLKAGKEETRFIDTTTPAQTGNADTAAS
jgi:hypothetical protein